MNDIPLTPPKTPAISVAHERLAKLEGYLQSDPANPHLLADTFEQALITGEFSRAQVHLNTAQSLSMDRQAWGFREASLLMANRRFEEAGTILMALARELGAHPVLEYNLAQIDFIGADYAACRKRLLPWMSGAVETPIADGDATALSLDNMRMLWLRSLHHLRALKEAWAWIEENKAVALTPEANGVASMIALDVNQPEAALRLSGQALLAMPTQVEAMVTQASLALAQRDAPKARELLGQVLERSPNEGRAWSALGFAGMLELRFDEACKDFEKAVSLMPGHIGTWHGLGWAFVMQRDLSSARRAFEVALELDRNFAESHGGLAVVLVMQRQTAAAQEHIERAIRLDRRAVSAGYAQALLSGEAADAAAVQRLAHRLLGQRDAPLGGKMSQWLPPILRR
ncbi:tetratricopeptide repeat protein [Variovorax terrae]|uniref:Tetratricopeptide repeat protein n=1 Tax=Variovorax terrae TaxID=2923278 RepID=A0A9X1VVH8_9BURK|nr:tetratricopeptide repeat protein [Variovorax terrae]MCJ0764531.1 hypothetical protein [Variovorax terrae]